MPQIDETEYKIHKETKKEKKLKKLNKDAGIDVKNIVKNYNRVLEKEKKPEWEIEAIVGQEKGPDEKMLYRIHWKRYGENEDTWQSYSDIKDTDAYSNWLSSKKKKY